MNSRILLTIILLISLCAANSASACGIFVSTDKTNVRANHIDAALLIPSAGQEALIFKMDYLVNKGSVANFGWIMPFPSKPSISEAPQDLFDQLSEETRPKKSALDRINFFSLLGGMGGASPKSSSSVHVVEEKKVGIFQTAVIQADDAKSLLEWAKDNQFTLPWLQEQNVQEYIKDHWYFSLMRINDVADVQNGMIKPIRFDFSADQPIYPISMASYDPEGKVNSKKTIPLTLYLIGPQKLQPNGAYSHAMSQSYAGEIQSTALKSSLQLSAQPYFITKWSKTFLSPDLNKDMTFEGDPQMADNGSGKMTGEDTFWLVVFLLLGGFIVYIPGVFILPAIVIIPLYIYLGVKKRMSWRIVRRTIGYLYFAGAGLLVFYYASIGEIGFMLAELVLSLLAVAGLFIKRKKTQHMVIE